MSNLLLEDIEYKIEKTSLGKWRQYLYPNGQDFGEFTSTKTLCGGSRISQRLSSGRRPAGGR